ncbi:hypothetical protein QYE76_011808 [Lolium multiflorum]|uniref:Transposase (putative) gypsy type domain-containing protein n=1 Tax=Lolium multiflorum TaxID=4521 RepID=A0AAD8TXN3_LOLMU|nr:hypothetical protein QYE76_011808 [Lolium multiflorum]
MATEDLEWERSKISNQDMNLLKRLGFTKKKDALRFPHEESYPSPPMEYRVSFVDHLIRGLSPPIHEFLRGLLFVYGLQLHQLTPNSILHVSIFITLVILFYLLFLPFPRVGKSKNGLLSPMTTRVGASRPESGVGGSQKSAASLEKENETEFSSSTRSSLPAASPKGKRKRDEAIDSGASKADTSRAEKTAPNAGEETLDLYDAALVSSGDEEEDAPIDETARTSTSRTLVVSEARPDGDETSPPPQNPEHPTPAPFMKELLSARTQFTWHRDYVTNLKRNWQKPTDVLTPSLLS